MADAERRRGLGLPFVPYRLPVPNPLAWLPRPGRLVRKRKLASVATITTTEARAAPSAGAGSKVPLKPASDVLAGALARAASQSTIHPLDTLKVRLQTRSMLKPQGMSKIGQLVPPTGARAGAAAFAGSAGAVGPKMDLTKFGASVGSLYRGVLGAASGAGIAIGAYFAVYGVACNVISQHTDWASGQVAFVAGGVAAVGSSFVKVPLAVCIRSVQAGVYPNAINAAKTIVRDAGWRGLFTGYLPTVLEDVPDMAIKFAAYESMRGMHARLNGGRVPRCVQSTPTLLGGMRMRLWCAVCPTPV
jgi:solute carrier family 25 S-adenosylmethionine transporter 26